MKNWIEIKKEDYEKYIRVDKLSNSTCKDDRSIAKELPYPGICEKTLKFLEFCTSYYEYIGIRTNTPEKTKKNNTWGLNFSVFGQPFNLEDKNRNAEDGYYNNWPAIWKAAEVAKIESSCGNHHQKQINNQLTTGLYWNKKGQWYKQII